ncbi:mitotic checkpoint protein BUB3.3-like [Actinidia eriantha]|uniref:mitotic checkpoint protein BUB3.3-like n=1 Tax=Actinidia eriantha TaxID=165200 RepID=UPI00258CEC6D|nr:mitotic checkpoint protein BUB3.3-like [Actinidia eriantha]
MSDEEHHFESKADAGASKTYPQQAGTIRKNGYIVIKNRPCKETCLKFENPIRDAVTKIRFAPKSNNLLISSWDSSLRLFDVDRFVLRVEAPSEAALLDCCFQNELVAFSAGSDGCVRRYDLDSGIHDTVGNHDDLVSCIEYSDETRQLITAGWDKKIMSWDTRSTNTLGCLKVIGADVESMTVSGFNLMVAIGSSVLVYDLRNISESCYVKELFPGYQIRCVRRILNSEGFVAGSIDGRIALEYLNSSDAGYVFWCHPKSKDGRHHVVPVNDVAFNPIISSAFVTGNNKGDVATWDAQSKRRIQQLPRYSNSVTSLSYNHAGRLLAVASSNTCLEANEIEEPPQIFIHEMDDNRIGSVSSGHSKLEKYYKCIYIASLIYHSSAYSEYSALSLSLSLSLGEGMSDEEHHFESKADAGASKTYPQQAGTIRKNGYIVIKNRPCKVVEVSTSKTGKHGHAKCHFVGIDIFNGKKLEDIVPSSHNCDVPHVNRTDYQLIDISEDGFVSLLTENGNTKDDLKLPTDENLLTQIKDGFGEGKDLVVSVMNAMGEEQICALKDIGPK